MNRGNDHNTERIERYLLNQLSEEERAQLQFELLTNPELKAQVKELRSIQKTLVAQKVKADNAAGHSNWLWLLLFFFFTAGVVLAWKYWSPSAPPAEQEVPQQIQPSPTGPPESKMPEAQPAAPSTTTPVEEAQPPASEPTSPPASKPEPKKKERLIAAADPADFAPADYLESLTEGFRGEVQLTQPANGSVIKLKDKTANIPLKGQLLGTAKEELLLLIYSNKVADFNAGKSTYQGALELRAAEGAFQFSSILELELTPGLYYFLIEKKQTFENELLYAGKFEVRP